MTDPIQTASALANAGDRVAFFVALFAIGFIGLWGARYLVNQNRELVQSLTEAHVGYQSKLETVVREQSALIVENTKATAAQTEALRSHSGAMRAVTEHLQRLDGGGGRRANA